MITRWHGLMLPMSWESFLKNKEKYLGYRITRKKNVYRIQRGDLILVYCGGAARWVGVCEVTGSPFVQKGKCHGSEDFPVRIPVRILRVPQKEGKSPTVACALPVEKGVARDDYMPNFRGTNKQVKGKEKWRGWIRGSPISYSERPVGPFPEDGKLVEKAIKRAARQKNRPESELKLRVLNWKYGHPRRVERKKEHEEEATKNVQRTKAGKRVAKARLTAKERLEVVAACNRGYDGKPPAALMDKAVAWAQKQKAKKTKKAKNFGSLVKGEIGLKLNKGRVKAEAVAV